MVAIFVCNWHLLPSSTFKFPAILLLFRPTPLFEKERNTCFLALISNIDDPKWIHWTRARAGFAADNHPVDCLQIQALERTQKRFERKKLDLCRGMAQMVDTKQIIFRLYAHTHPNVRGPGQDRIKFEQAGGTFGQNLELVPVGPSHHVKSAQDKFHWNILVEEVTHRIDKDGLRFFPL